MYMVVPPAPVAVTAAHDGLAFFFVGVGSIFSVLDSLADVLADSFEECRLVWSLLSWKGECEETG